MFKGCDVLEGENGTKYNHEYGLLNLDRKEAGTQIDKVRTVLTAQK